MGDQLTQDPLGRRLHFEIIRIFHVYSHLDGSTSEDFMQRSNMIWLTYFKVQMEEETEGKHSQNQRGYRIR